MKSAAIEKQPKQDSPKQRVQMLVKPTHWWSQAQWDVLENDEFVTTLDVAATMYRNNVFQLGSDFYEIKRRGWYGTHTLLHRGEAIATAKPSFSTRKCNVEFGDTKYQLRPQGFPGLRYELESGGRAIGRVRPVGAFASRATADFPSELAPALRVFVLWLFMTGSVAYQVAI